MSKESKMQQDIWNWKQYCTLALQICILLCLYLHHLSTNDLLFLLLAGPWLPAILLRYHSLCISTSYRLQRGHRKLFYCNQLQNKPRQSATGIGSYSKRQINQLQQDLIQKGKEKVIFTSLFTKNKKKFCCNLLYSKVNVCHKAHQFVPHCCANFRTVWDIS